jgi:hypothetical protein
MIIYHKQKYLIKWGRAVEATITGKKEGKITITTYRFLDADGKNVEGVRKSWNWPTNAFLNNPTVVYDPRNSAKNVLYRSDWVVCYLPL